MKSVWLILFNQRKAFERIDKTYNDELNRKSIYLFSAYAIARFIYDYDPWRNPDGIIYNLFLLLLVVGISILIFMVLSVLITWIGRKLNGVAKKEDIESIIAHSLIPVIIGLLVVWWLKKSTLSIENWNGSYLRNSLLIISWLFSLKILVSGVKYFNKFTYAKSLITILPIVLINIGGIGMYFYFTK